MSLFNDIVDQIKYVLESNEKFADISLLNSFSSVITPNPLNKACITFGISDMKIKETSFSRYLGFRNGNEYYGNLAEINLSLCIYSPNKYSAEKCYDIFYNAYEALFNYNNNLNIISISCGKLVYNEYLFCYSLLCNLKLNTFIGQLTNDGDISSIEVFKGKERLINE